jgi:prepilin-type N-terminal cleavage/methylation domain-containing protein
MNKVAFRLPARWQNQGFTIVELLIVIAIISILAAITVVGYNVVQTSTNDTQREADVTSIMNALERYYDKNGEYPANDTLNPDAAYPRMTDFAPVKALLPDLPNDALTGPNDYQFYPGCVNSTVCTNSSSDWATYMTKAYIYSSRYSTQGGSAYAYFNVPSTFAGGNGWGCNIRTYYADPGYMIAWYKLSTKLWVFERSKHGIIDISNNAVGPVAPQTCTFSS